MAVPRVVILGAGFGGLAAASALKNSGIAVTIVDRNNYHLFVPLLYQVATAALSPRDIAAPIRKVFRRAQNVEAVLGEVTGIDTAGRTVALDSGLRLAYDRLVVATGSQYNYFGHDEWAEVAPGLKTIEDARRIRSRILLSLEKAELADDPARRAALMTTIIVGGGPTGVELAGAIAELNRYSLSRDFRRIDPGSSRVLLVEAGPRLLAGFDQSISDYAVRRLERLGIEVLTGRRVESITAAGATIDGTFTPAGTVIWAAGIRASPVAGWLGAPLDRAGRIIVGPDLSVPGVDGVYAIGDIAAFAGDDGKPLPALAQVAKQQGRHLGTALAAELTRGEPVPAFRFRNRGNAGIIGRNAAFFDFGRWRLKAWPAWILWAVLHVWLLVGFENRLLVTVQWLWRYVSYQRGARLITHGEAAEASTADRQGEGGQQKDRREKTDEQRRAVP